MELNDVLIVVIAGLAAGGLGPMVGLGGGIVLVPILHLGLGLPFEQATATSLVGITATSIGGSLQNLKKGAVEVELGLALEVAALIGVGVALLGPWQPPEHILRWLFSAVLIFVAWRLLAKSSGGEVEGAKLSLLAASPVAVFAGWLATVLGVGGGVIKVPLLRFGLGMSMLRSVATSTFMIGLTAGTAAVLGLVEGHADVQRCLILVAAILPASWLGASLAHRLPRRVLERLFGAVAVVVALRMVIG